MKALWLDGDVSLRRDLQVPRPKVGEASIRVRLAGICATDLELMRGYYPFRGILGHEFVGEIAHAPDAPERIGERVVGEINLSCGTCAHCVAGRRSHCKQRSVLGIKGHDGAFADYLTLPLSNLHRVPDLVSDEAAVFTEPLAAALQIPTQIQLAPDRRVLVIGARRLGQLIARVLALGGCDLAVVARHPAQRIALESVGIVWLAEDDLRGRHWDIVVEATGSTDGFAAARQAVRPAGTIVLKSTYRGSVEMNLASLVVDEVRLIGSRCGPFPAALRLLQRRLLDPLDLIDSRYPLTRGPDALRRAAEPGAMKVLIDCSWESR